MEKKTKLLISENAVILDFPHKDEVFVDDISDKAESCFIECVKAREQLFSCKEFLFRRYFADTVQSADSISLEDNFLFKGNNLIVLHSILPVFRGTVKLIYIDPPYNTGNTFVYKDKFSRAVWLLFMKNRLETAWEFLRPDGILAVQCDENEQAYLKVLMDELFGEENSLGVVAVVMNPGGRDYRSIARTHEYILFYGKTSQAQLYPLPKIDKPFPFHDRLGGFELRSLRNGNIRFHEGNRPNLRYAFYVDPSKTDKNGLHPVFLTKKKGRIEIFPKESQGIKTVWRWSKEKAKANLAANLAARASKDTFLIFEKYRKDTKLVRSIWTEKEFQTSKGTRHIKEMFSYSAFDYPKPEQLIARIIEVSTLPSDRVMDFFLGSGTTAAAAHKMGRSWIGIEQMHYIDTVTLLRLQKVLAGEPGGVSAQYGWKGGGNFLYAQLLSDDKHPFGVNYIARQDKSCVSAFYNLSEQVEINEV